ncbi:hypothetical protein B1H10_07985 [candidate division KSB1 bacterium 4484_188]|nr:MAG: hypothetical protein B1H10_07985 [candidate division KSB1 bacterium 4484_188]
MNNTPFRKGGKGDLKMIPYRKDLKAVTRDLRKNMTDAEKLLWSEIRSKQLKDFNKLGLRVKRYSDREVLKNINDVLEDIYKLL